MISTDGYHFQVDIESDDYDSSPRGPNTAQEQWNSAIASLIHHSLVILLLRAHRSIAQAKSQRKDGLAPNSTAAALAQSAFPLKAQPILGSIISLLQYHSFTSRLRRILNDISTGLKEAGMANEVDMTSVGDDLKEVLARSALLLDESDGLPEPSPLQHQPTPDTALSYLMMERENLLRLSGEATLRVAGR